MTRTMKVRFYPLRDGDSVDINTGNQKVSICFYESLRDFEVQVKNLFPIKGKKANILSYTWKQHSYVSKH